MFEHEELTPSPVSNQIMALCEAIMAGNGSSQDLKKALEAALEGMTSTWNDFKHKIDASGPDHLATYNQEIEEINQAFEQFKSALEEVALYFIDNKTSHLDEGRTKIKYSTYRMIRALNAYQSKELAVGPTDIPYVNFLIKAADALKTGKIDLNLFLGMVKEAGRNAELAMEAAKKEEPSKEINYIIEAYQEHIKVYQAIGEKAGNKDYEGLKVELDNLALAASKLKDAFQKINLKMLTSLPTPSPYVNLMINVTRSLINNEVPEEVFVKTLQSFKTSLQNMFHEFELYSRVPTNSLLVAEEIEKAHHAFELFDQAVKNFDQFLEFRNVGLLENAIKTLEEAGNLLHQSFTSFQEIAEREGKIPCVKCQHYNPIELKRCEKCGASLMRMAEATTSTFSFSEESQEVGVTVGEMVMTENLQKLFDAVNAVSEGNISLEEYLEVLDWLDQLTLNEYENTQRIPELELKNLPEEEKKAAEKIKEHLGEIKQNMLSGMEEFRTGLNTLRMYANNPEEQNYLTTGVREVWQAAAKIYQAGKTAEELQAPKP